MDGFQESDYGDQIADVYDEWYGDLPGLEAAVTYLTELAGAGPVLELGVGSGRVAVPLSAHVEVVGLDNSAEMLALMATKPGGDRVRAVVGDMAAPMPGGPYSLVFVAVNTLFNLLTAQRQQACFDHAAAALAPGGCFVVEAFVPVDGDVAARDEIAVRSMAADRLVLSVSRSMPAEQRAEGQYVEITESGGVRLRPWSIRWASPAQLDAMATRAGLRLRGRRAGWAATDDNDVNNSESSRLVSVYEQHMSAPALS